MIVEWAFPVDYGKRVALFGVLVDYVGIPAANEAINEA